MNENLLYIAIGQHYRLRKYRVKKIHPIPVAIKI